MAPTFRKTHPRRLDLLRAWNTTTVVTAHSRLPVNSPNAFGRRCDTEVVMTTRNVALAAVIGVLVAAGSLMAAPAANASCNPVGPADDTQIHGGGCWAALAVSLSTGQATIESGERSPHKAEDRAVLNCNVNGGTNDCQVVVSGTEGCISLGVSSDGGTYYGRMGPSLEASDAAALDAAGPGGTISIHHCAFTFGD